MILSYNEAYDIVDELAKDMPEAFYTELSGGVVMLEEEYRDPLVSDLYILGEYCEDELGKYICLYYGSFAKVLASQPREKWVEELGSVMRKEFTHAENQAGANHLYQADDEFLAAHQGELILDWEDLTSDED